MGRQRGDAVGQRLGARDDKRGGEAALVVQGVQELLEFAFVEAEEAEVGAVDAELFQELSQVVLDPFAPLGVVAEGAFAGEGPSSGCQFLDD